MLTLFTKTPLPKGVNQKLLNVFGYKPRDKSVGGAKIQGSLSKYFGISEPEYNVKEKELHVTVDSLKPNSVGLKLEIRGNSLYIANDREIDAYYDKEYLKFSFEKKYTHKLVYVLASSKREDSVEQFWFNEVSLLSGFSFERFSEGIKNGIVKLDIRIGHYPNGRLHDHGTGFRVLPKHLHLCFADIKKVI